MKKTVNELINHYKQQLSFFEELILNTKDETFKNCYLVIAKELSILEKSDIKLYEEKLNKLEIEYRKPKKESENSFEEAEKIEDDKLEDLEEKPIDEEKKDNESEEGIEIPQKIEKNINSVDDYVFKKIYMSKDEIMKDKFQKLILNLQTTLESSNIDEIKKWINEYLLFVDDYKSLLDKEDLLNVMKKYFERYDKKKIFIDKLDDYLKENIDNEINVNIKEIESNKSSEVENKLDNITESNDNVDEKPLKIINIKKKHIVGLESLKVLAMIGIGATTGLGGFLTSWVIFRLARRGLKSNKFNSLLEKYGYKIVNDELVDKDGKKVSEEKVEKEKVGFFKRKLMNLDKYKDDGLIKKSYKKNKITSMLLNMKLVDSMKKHFKFNNVYEDTTIKNEEYKKGMGKC